MSWIRQAVPADHPQLSRIKQRASLSNPADRAFLAQNPALARELEPADLWVFDGPEGITGYVALGLRKRAIARVQGLFVDPNHMRRGVGTELVAQCVRLARQAGAKTLDVEINPNAVEFYRAQGFHPPPPSASDDPWKLML